MQIRGIMGIRVPSKSVLICVNLWTGNPRNPRNPRADFFFNTEEKSKRESRSASSKRQIVKTSKLPKIM